MNALERRALCVDLTDERGGGGEELKVGDPKRLALVGTRQRSERVAPRALRVRPAPALDLGYSGRLHVRIVATPAAGHGLVGGVRLTSLARRSGRARRRARPALPR
jgi:hypothetical protein